MSTKVFLGDEAVAQGAIDAGISGAFGYPGTPSTEILEFLSGQDNVMSHWCANEKTAFETALGMSFSGKRSIVTMKHVGLNVAADPFMNSALLSINGGLVIAVADDPGMHSSQNEQDSRFFADFAGIPCLEPSTQQEAYEMTLEAFEISEKFSVPVMVRMTTRISHSRAVVKIKEKSRDKNSLNKGNPKEWILIPAYARKNYENLLQKQQDMAEWAENFAFTKITPGDEDFVVITTGIGKNYFLENRGDFNGEGPAHFHLATLPIPQRKLRAFCDKATKILVVEEGQPLLEKKLRGILPSNRQIMGKLSGELPASGELTPDLVRSALDLPAHDSGKPFPNLPGRPPQLCKGCPHFDSYTAINGAGEKLKAQFGETSVMVASDIGCYALGICPPLNCGETIICMGSSIGVARGASMAGVKYAFAVIGDSTFFHSGLTGITDAVSANSSVVICILDNSIVAMTGCQETILPSQSIINAVEGLGVKKEHIRVLTPLPAHLEENIKVLKEEAEFPGPSVVIFKRECLEALRKAKKMK